jgi:argininosuccinate synthase
LETSLDAVNWEIVQTIPAAGFSQELLNYSAVDQDAARNKKYYRLKQVDFNGEFEMYGPLKADCAVESSDISLYPNPCETQVTVSVASQISTELNYTLISPEGKVLENKQMAVQSGMTVYTLDVSGYPSGMYILQFDLNDKRFIKKLTVQ